MTTRNADLALAQKHDPARFRSRTVETERRKLRHTRARRKADLRREGR